MKAILLCVAIFLANSLFSQKNISGSVKDRQNNEALPFSNIVLKQGEKIISGTAADLNGFFSLKNVPEGVYELRVTYLGYQIQSMSIELSDKDRIVHLSLAKGINLKEVVIECKRDTENFTHTMCSLVGNSYCSSSYCLRHRYEKSDRKPEEEKKEKIVVQHLTVFPNPSTGENVSLSYQNSAAVGNYYINYAIHDLLGKQIESRSALVVNGQLNLKINTFQNLPKGNYFISLSDKSFRSTKKIIIQ